jgi:short-subunit dehydrogenase
MFENRVALITGGSAGIGLAVARKWVAAGGVAALAARTRATLDEAVAALGGGTKAAAFAIDVGDLAALEKLPAQVVSRFGRLDAVINNAGTHHRGPLIERTPTELAEMVSTNLAAPMILTWAAVPVLETGGVIVNVASLAGMVPVRNAAAYSATKAGLRAFAVAVGEELRPRGIRVATVSPGPVDTNFFGDLSKVADIVFSQPMSTPEQVADAVLECLCKDRREVAMPWFSGKLATLGYLAPSLSRALQPMLARLGAKKKRAYAERRVGPIAPPRNPRA